MSTGRVIAKEHLVPPSTRLESILVATDFSAGARLALERALRVAERPGCRVYLAHVISAGALQYVSPDDFDEAMEQARVFATEQMKQLVDELGCAANVEQVILSGSGVWQVLQEFVETHGIELIVLGTQGRTQTKKRLLGPVAEEIFRLAECPVLTVGQQTGEERSGDGTLRRILFATNFKPHAERAAPYAYALERKHEAQLVMLNVVEEEQTSSKGGHTFVREFMINRMRKGMPAECIDRCEPEFQVRFGDAAEQILLAAREEKCDLIVLGVRGGAGAEGELPSATAYKLVCQAGCPVLTVRQ